MKGFSNMFKKAKIEIYELDLLDDIITTSPGDFEDNVPEDDGDIGFPFPLK